MNFDLTTAALIILGWLAANALFVAVLYWRRGLLPREGDLE